MLNFNKLFNQTQMIYISKQFICIYHIDPKAIRYHQGKVKQSKVNSFYTVMEKITVKPEKTYVE